MVAELVLQQVLEKGGMGRTAALQMVDVVL